MIAMLVAGQARALTFDFTGAETTWVAPVSGVYDITAYGAQGAALRYPIGGLGAEAGGDVFLTAGTTLTLLVGGKPPEGGGGGGSFVFGAGATTLVAAGGGGGADSTMAMEALVLRPPLEARAEGLFMTAEQAALTETEGRVARLPGLPNIGEAAALACSAEEDRLTAPLAWTHMGKAFSNL